MENGIHEKSLDVLENMLKELIDLFRIKLGSYPPDTVPQLIITPIKNETPYRSPETNPDMRSI